VLDTVLHLGKDLAVSPQLFWKRIIFSLPKELGYAPPFSGTPMPISQHGVSARTS